MTELFRLKVYLFTLNCFDKTCLFQKPLVLALPLNFPFLVLVSNAKQTGGGRVVRWCWVSFQCRGVLLIWNRVGQGPTVLAVGAGRGCLDICSLVFHFSFLFPSLWETARYRLKYCLKGPLKLKQPTNSQADSQGL